MKRMMIVIPAVLLAVLPLAGAEFDAPTRAEVEAAMGLPSDGDRVRGQMDTVGFVTHEAQAEEVVAAAVALETEGSSLTGELLRYGTSLEGPELAVSTEARDGGLGYTAPSNLHHWVGCAAVGYHMPNR